MVTKNSNAVGKRVLGGIGLGLLLAVGVGLAIGNSLAYGTYATVISHHLCPNGDSSSDSANSARNMGNALAREIEREGIVMLHNNGTLPLNKSVSRVNVFGHGSIDWYIMSSGSERVGTDGQTSYDLNSALQQYGIEVNDELPTYYTKWHKKEGDANTIMASFDSFYQVREPGLEGNSEYQNIYDRAKDYSDTAFMVISRHAGENSDCPHYQTKVEGQPTDNTRTYLEISTEEEYTLRQLANDFENVILVINSTNTMMLDYIDKINEDIPDGIDACISVGATGVQGALSIPEILWGDASPSGHLTDTIPYDFRNNVTYFRGNAKHTHQYTGAPSGCTTMGAGGSAFYRTSVYVEYTEGIYVGYRWFETADAEGFWDTAEYGGYDKVVQYPFGFGLSYTTFDWELVETSKPQSEPLVDNKEVITLTVQVKNTGDVAGKDVIEVYLTAPYTPGGIEKSYVKLVAYAKTPELQPGQSAKVNIDVETKEFKSYDDYDANGNGFCGYEMEAGDYELKLMTDAHHMKEGMEQNTIVYKLNDDLQITEDEKSGNTVENRFTGDTAYEEAPIDGSSVDQGIEFIHRNNFPELLKEVEPNKPWNEKLLNRANGRVATNSCYTASSGSTLDAWDEATTDYFGNDVPTDKPTWGAAGDLKLMEGGELTDLGARLAANYDDPDWDALLDQVPFAKAQHILTMDTQYKCPGIAAIGMRSDDDGAYQHAEGASQVGNGVMAPNTSCVGYPGSTVLAQTWNQTLAFMYGKSEGNDMGPAGKDALYSPACNIHRSPFGGRNSGYQSEDPYLSGRVVGNLIRGLGVYGKTSFMKHFALNDQDFNRMGLYTWCTEQALREIYLRTFEEGVKYGDSTGIMTSFNRIGNIWAGGNEALIQGILRYEWGFKGAIITDMTENKTNMDGGAGLRAGGNINLGGYQTKGKALNENSSPRLLWRAREAIKQLCYSNAHALYKNMTYNEAADPQDAVIVYESKLAWQWWKPLLVTIDAVVYGGLLIAGWFIVTKTFVGKKEEF